MKKINKDEMFYLDYHDDNFKMKLIDIFLQNQNAIVSLDDEKFITYDSFIEYISNPKKIYISFMELAESKINVRDELDNEWQNTSINLSRWKYLYSNNDKIINYLRYLKPKKVYIMGTLSENLYNYINVYGNNFETCIINSDYNNYVNAISDENAVLIDTDLFSQQLKKEILKNEKLNKNILTSVLNINELCNNAELYYFVNDFLENDSFDIMIFEFPDNNQFTNLSFSEQLRIKSKVNYIYYLSNYEKDPEIKALIEKVLGEIFTEDYIYKENLSPGTILKNGICRLSDSDNDFCRSTNGLRYTTDKNYDFAYDINVFGPCMIFGALVDDKHTITSYLQRRINKENKDYSINNYGLRAMELPEQIRIADAVNIKQGDKMIFVVSTKEKEKLASLGYHKVTSLLPVFNNTGLHDYFLDKPVHCNHIANSHIANFIYENIKSKLVDKNPNNKCTAVPLKKAQKRNVFTNNRFIDEYLAMLNQLNIPNGPNGAILVNCNPFTYGHYNLIQYASNQVEELFVIVVEDDKSIFKFNDRFKMVKDGCKNFPNVTVIPSGKIFGSSMIFPEYFNREEKTDVTIDVSLDIEIFANYIAPILNVKKRFVGEEKTDVVTATYNRELKNNLPLYGIEVIEIPRFKDKNSNSISAKTVRNALSNDDWEKIGNLVPQSTLDVLKSYQTKQLQKIKK